MVRDLWRGTYNILVEDNNELQLTIYGQSGFIGVDYAVYTLYQTLHSYYTQKQLPNPKQNLLESALYVALNAHQGQTDKAGEPYILHPLRVAAQMPDTQLKIIALLHDVVEDSNYTIKMLETIFPQSITTTVKNLTRPPGLPYMDYIEGLSNNILAVTVKLADLKDNMDVTRLNAVTDEDIKRLKKYHKAYQYLLQAKEFLNQKYTPNDLLYTDTK